MILLAAMAAMAALMMAATPALAQSDKVTICHTPPPNDFTLEVPEEAVAGHLGHGDYLGECKDNDNNVNDNDNNNNNDRDFRNFCRFFDCNNNNDNNNNVVPVFEISQDLDQDAESGDVDQSFDVSNTGDNSNQTAGIQGVANTGNAQNQIGVIDAGNGFGDFDNNNDDDLCDVFGGDFCDNNDHGFFIFDDDDNNDDDGFFTNNGSDFEFDNVGSTIEVSPTNMTSSDQQVNQAATAFGK